MIIECAISSRDKYNPYGFCEVIHFDESTYEYAMFQISREAKSFAISFIDSEMIIESHFDYPMFTLHWYMRIS